MGKIAVVYWSGTGNTEAMAQAVAEGVQAQGGEAALFTAGKFDVDMAGAFNAIAFGCPSMGSEELEESEFAPMFAACEPELKDKPIALFGSYGWGDGEWMRTWTDTCSNGAILACEPVICNEAPDEDAWPSAKRWAERWSLRGNRGAIIDGAGLEAVHAAGRFRF